MGDLIAFQIAPWPRKFLTTERDVRADDWLMIALQNCSGAVGVV